MKTMLEKLKTWTSIANISEEQQITLTSNNLFAAVEYVHILTQRAEAAEAKLAELEKQKSVAEVVSVLRGLQRVKEVAWREGISQPVGTELFTRPAPAINLAELVPDEMPRYLIDELEWRSEKKDGLECYHMENGQRWWDKFRAAVLRKIEEAK